MVILKMAIFSKLWKVDLGPFGNKLFKYVCLYVLKTYSMHAGTMIPLHDLIVAIICCLKEPLFLLDDIFDRTK